MPIEEIIIKRSCKKCSKFHYKKSYKIDNYPNVNECLLDIEWQLYKIQEGYYKDNDCKYCFRRD